MRKKDFPAGTPVVFIMGNQLTYGKVVCWEAPRWRLRVSVMDHVRVRRVGSNRTMLLHKDRIAHEPKGGEA